jgi:hypothetical protein
MPEGGRFIPEQYREPVQPEPIPPPTPEVVSPPDTEVEDAFFRGWTVNRAELEAQHPFGLDVAPESVKQSRREQANSIFQKIRESTWARPLMGMMAMLAGVGNFAFDRLKDRATVSKEETVEVATDDLGVQYEMQRLVIEELMKSGEMTVEQEGRFGRQSWNQLQRLAYQDFPTLDSKFEYLHKDNPDVIASYKDPRGRLDNYRQLYEMMSLEFRHSSLPFQFSEQCIEDAVSLIPNLPPEEAVQVYNGFTQELARSVGFRAVREMSQQLADTLPAAHPVLQQIEQQQWLSPEAADWLKPQKDNSAYFDQVTGRIMVYHQVGDTMVLLDTFPGNGGPANGVAWERGLPAQVAVRTPDGEFKFARAFEKKSASWQYSWVTDTSPLRWNADQTQVDYQDEDGTWRRLTGQDAEFTTMGAPQKPFKEKKKSSLYNAAIDRTGDTVAYPAPFSRTDVVDEEGNLRSTWDLNDFGPRSIQMNDAEGKAMSVFFHSSPHDEAKEESLINSHGCIHMKPIDVDVMSSYLTKGSKIRISSTEVPQVAQTENRGSASADPG